MHVQGFWINGEGVELSYVDSEDGAFRKMSVAWRKGTLIKALSEQRRGSTVQFRSGDELLVIGGRDSIRSAFKNDPISGWEFAPAQGEMLYFSAHRKSRDKGKALGLGTLALIKSIGNPELRDKIGKVMSIHSKTYTALHIHSAKSDPDGGTGLGYPSLKGAMMSQVLKQLVFKGL